MGKLKPINPNYLIKLRTDKELSQAELAKAIGIDQGSISAWERGTKSPSKLKRCELAAFFDISLDDLTSGVVESDHKSSITGLTEEDVRRVVRQEVGYLLDKKLQDVTAGPVEQAKGTSQEKHLNKLLDQAIAREQELERELELERRRRIPDLDRYRRNKETIQALKENHPELHISEDDEEDFCIHHLGFYGGVLSTNVMGEIERLRERRRLVDNVKDLFGQQPEVAKRLLELLEQAGGVEKLKSIL